MDFDETRLYVSHLNPPSTRHDPEDSVEPNEVVEEDEQQVDLSIVRRHFREFLRELRTYFFWFCAA